jgi:hypothetical protein
MENGKWDKWDLNKTFLVKVLKNLENLSKNPKLKIWSPCSNLHTHLVGFLSKAGKIRNIRVNFP